ncbi:MAG TPA: ATP-binding cassette domain-containing protein, partial [Bacillota bacterium]
MSLAEMPEQTQPVGSALLAVEGLVTGYGRKQVIFDVSMRIQPGEVVALIGHNGAGKTTTLKALFGLLPVWQGEVYFAGERITHASSADNVRRGMVFLPQEHFVFPDLTVGENLEIGGFTVASARARAQRRQWVYDLMPVLRERDRQLAGTLSGGE